MKRWILYLFVVVIIAAMMISVDAAPANVLDEISNQLDNGSKWVRIKNVNYYIKQVLSSFDVKFGIKSSELKLSTVKKNI